MKKRIIAIIAVCMLMLLTFTSCDTVKSYETEGFYIELPAKYIDISAITSSGSDIVATYTSLLDGGATVTAIETPYTDYVEGSNVTLDDYVDAIIDVVDADGEVIYVNGNPAVEYVSDDLATLALAFKGENGMWMVSFSCATEDYDSMREDFLSYAETVRVD